MGSMDGDTSRGDQAGALADGITGHYVHVPLPDTCQEFESLTLRGDGSYGAKLVNGSHEDGQFQATSDTLFLTNAVGDLRGYQLEAADGAIQLTGEECSEVLSLSDEPECSTNEECGADLICDVEHGGVCVSKPVRRPVEESDTTPCEERTGGAVVTFDVHGETLNIWSTNDEFIARARTLVGNTEFHPTPVFNVMRRGFDSCTGRQWSVNPEDMHFNDLTTEVCDAMPSYIDDNLEDWLVAPAQYCPWGPRVIAVSDVR